MTTTSRTTTGHVVTVDAARGYVTIAGDLDTMQSIPEAEIDAACAAAGVRCTWEPVDATTYRCEARRNEGDRTRVRDYDTGNALPGRASRALVQASADAGPTGAVAAYRDGQGEWQYVHDAVVDHYRRTLGWEVRTVYVEAGATITFTAAAQANIEETGANVTADVEALRSGAHTRESLLAHCLDGADEDRAEGWRDYVEAVATAAER